MEHRSIIHLCGRNFDHDVACEHPACAGCESAQSKLSQRIHYEWNQEVPNVAVIQGISVLPSPPDGPEALVNLQYTDQSNEWFKLEIPPDQALRLLEFLSQARREIQR
jgi:hypothetical protein